MVKNVINGFNLVKIGHFWRKWSKVAYFGSQNDVICQNFWVGRKYFFLKTVSKVVLARFINLTVVKDVINGFNFVKIGHFKSKYLIFGENGQNWVILSSKITS